MSAPRQLLYHFTHVDNLEPLLAERALLSDTAVRSRGLLRVEAGHREIKERRRRLQVGAGPSGSPSDYVPFYFCTRSPMLLSISGGRVPFYSGGQDPLVYLVTSVGRLVELGLSYAYSDGNCASSTTTYHDDLAALEQHVDLPLMAATWWHDTNEDTDRQRRRMAEFLVHERVPWNAILGLVVRTAETAGLVGPRTTRRRWRVELRRCQTRLVLHSRVRRCRTEGVIEEVSMIEKGCGNLLDTDVEALVNTVNTVGVMGKGIALQFKRAFPDNYRAYAAACTSRAVRLGSMFVFDREVLGSPRWIINFPTKAHWRSRSRLQDIDDGLRDLVRTVRELGIESVALPALGCGNGGLDWSAVEPRVTAAFETLPHVRCVVFPPSDAPAPADMRTGGPPPPLTPFRARTLCMMQRYTRPAAAQQLGTVSGASLLETQKLAYLGQQVGLDLDLAFERGLYGPYSPVLDRALADLEGHHTVGLGDRTGKVLDLHPIAVLPEAAAAAEEQVRADPAADAAIHRLLSLVEGFETAYGLELLSSVHFVAQQHGAAAAHPEAARGALASWSRRKARLFTDVHVTAAWDRLDEHGLLGAGA